MTDTEWVEGKMVPAALAYCAGPSGVTLDWRQVDLLQLQAHKYLKFGVRMPKFFAQIAGRLQPKGLTCFLVLRAEPKER